MFSHINTLHVAILILYTAISTHCSQTHQHCSQLYQHTVFTYINILYAAILILYAAIMMTIILLLMMMMMRMRMRMMMMMMMMTTTLRVTPHWTLSKRWCEPNRPQRWRRRRWWWWWRRRRRQRWWWHWKSHHTDLYPKLVLTKPTKTYIWLTVNDLQKNDREVVSGVVTPGHQQTTLIEKAVGRKHMVPTCLYVKERHVRKWRVTYDSKLTRVANVDVVNGIPAWWHG